MLLFVWCHNEIWMSLKTVNARLMDANEGSVGISIVFWVIFYVNVSDYDCLLRACSVCSRAWE